MRAEHVARRFGHVGPPASLSFALRPNRVPVQETNAPEVNMFIFVRAVTYASLFIGLLLVYVPARLLSWFGMVGPAAIGAPQIIGMVVGAAGSVIALWCILTFAAAGTGTPIPLAPPHR